MSTIASLRIPAAEFALAETLEAVPTAEFEVVPVVAHGGRRPMPFVWATGGDDGAVDEALADDPSVESAERVSTLDTGWLYRVTWGDAAQSLVETLVAEDAVVMSALGRRDEWHVHVLFPSRESLSVAYDGFETRDVTLHVESIHELEEPAHYRRYGLSDEQHTTLVRGYERGFYDIPRAIDTSDLSTELGITHQALSERLRRGHRTLVKNALLVGSDGLK